MTENIKGSGGGGGCFFEGAKIQTSHGIKPIEIVKKNQLVVAFDAFGALDFGVVVDVHKHHKSDIDPIVQAILVLSNGEVFDSTDNHIIPCNDAFKAAEDIDIGDTVYDAKGNPLTVESLHLIPRPDVEYVYNLTIEPHHTFIANGLRVHNGGKKKKAPPAPREAANTLRSTALARTIELLSEGEIVGLVNGAKSIYFDDTPVQSADGTYNYNRINYAVRLGTPGQSYVPGFSAAEASFPVNTVVTQSAAVSRTMSTANVDAARVIIQLDEGLSKYDTTTGNLDGSNVHIEIDRRISGGTWELVVSDNIVGKTMSVYQRNYRVNRPLAAGIWEIRIRRITPDSTASIIKNKVSCYGYVEIVEAKLNYDEAAYIALAIDSESVGGSAPTRSYDILGLKIKYPSNYDPFLRTYFGVWDGTFVTGWSDNPAWVVYDLLTNPKHGAGSYIDALTIDKWSFYQAGVYNDGLVPDGNGGMEPRFTFNSPISTSTGLWNLVQSVASVCRAVVFFGGGTIRLVQDRPSNPVKLISNSDVIDGEFSYVGSGLMARHTAANITFNDANNKYLPRVISLQDNAAIARYGYNVTDIAAYGAVTEGQARRFGKWLIDTEINQTESVNFNVSFNCMDLVPGDVIKLMDNNYAGAQLAGKIASPSANTVLHLDREVDLKPSTTYTVTVLSSDLSEFYERTVNNVSGKTSTLTFSSTMFDTIPPGNPWMLSSSSVKPRLFRVVGIQEQSKNQFGISAVYYDKDKYARVELGIFNPPDVFSAFTEDEVGLVNNARAQIEGFVDPVKGPIVNLHVFWDKPTNSRFALFYTILYNFNGGQYSPSVTTDQLDFIIKDVTQGEYQILITAYNVAGVQGQTLKFQHIFNYGGSNILNPPVNLRLTSGAGTVFETPELDISWDANVANNGISQAVGGYRINVEDLITSEFLYAEVVGQSVTSHIIPHGMIAPHRQLKVKVYTLDSIKRDSATAVSATFTNSAPALPAIVGTDDGIDRIEVTVSGNTEGDLDGLLIWMSNSTGFIPSSDNLVYDDLYKDSIFIDAWAGIYYIRVAAYDTYSKTGLNVSSEFSAEAINFADVAVPDVPTGLTLSSKLEVQPNGSQTASLIATWSPAQYASEYILQMRDVTASTIYSESIVAGLRYTWTGLLCANTYGVKIKARNISVDSAYSAESTLVTAKDTVAPGPISGLTAIASFKNIFLSWTNPVDKDLAGIEIWVNTVNNRATATKLAEPNDDTYNHGGLATGQTRYYWLRASDRSGNLSTWFPVSATAGVSATTSQIATADYQNLSIVNAAIGLLAVDNAKIANSTITNAKIADLTIESGKIKDAQITTAKIANLAVTFAQIADATIKTINIDDGQITTAKIDDLAVTEAKIANLSVTNGKIANATIQGAKIADATITNGKIANATIQGAKIANAAIKTANIDDSQITNAKIANATIQGAKIANATITGANIASATIADANIATATITGAKIAGATIMNGNIANAQITNAKIADLQVDSLKIANGAVSSTQVQAPYLGWNFNWNPNTRDTHVFDIRFWIPVAGYKYQGYMKFDVKFTFHIAPTSTPYVMAQQMNNPPFASIRTVLDIHNESVPGGWHMFSRDNTQNWTFGQNNPWWYDVYFSGYLWFDFNAQLLFRLSVQPTPGNFLSTSGAWIPTNFAYDHYTVGVSTLYK